MEYNPDQHSLKCPKCGHGMNEVSYGNITIDVGQPAEGRKWDAVEDIACPRCQRDMEKTCDAKQPHIWYETCSEHGLFMDAGEFTDYKYETLVDRFRSLIKGAR